MSETTNTHQPDEGPESKPREFRYPDGSSIGRYWAKIRRVINHGTPAGPFVEPYDEWEERMRVQDERDEKLLEAQDMTDEQFVAEIEASYKRHNELLAKTFVPNPDMLESVRQNKDKFAALRQGAISMTPVLEARLLEDLSPKKRKETERALRGAPDAIVKYTVRIHMLDCLLEGTLAKADCMARVTADPAMAALDAGDAANVYTLFLERMLEKKQILESPSA